MYKRKKTKFMKKIFVTVILFALLFCPKAKSVSLYGFQPASVDSLPIHQFANKPHQMKEVELATFLAKIDKNGKLKSLECKEEENSILLDYIEAYVHTLTFQPAKLKGKKKKSILPFQVLFAKRVYSPQFIFPLEKEILVQDNELFEYACILNELELPKIMSFPSYFADMNLMDSSNRYPFVIQKTNFEDGLVKSIENQMSSYDPFVEQIQSAILYAEIQQPKVMKKLIEDDLYLMVSFFPQLSYPVAPFNGNQYDSTNLFHNHRVRLINRFSSFLSEPIPKSSRSNRFPRKFIASTFRAPIDFLVKIDTLGRAVVVIPGTKNMIIA